MCLHVKRLLPPISSRYEANFAASLASLRASASRSWSCGMIRSLGSSPRLLIIRTDISCGDSSLYCLIVLTEVGRISQTYESMWRNLYLLFEVLVGVTHEFWCRIIIFDLSLDQWRKLPLESSCNLLLVLLLGIRFRLLLIHSRDFIFFFYLFDRG